MFQVTMPATISFSSNIREIIWSLLDDNSSFSYKWKYRIQLVTDELINNAIEHWSIKWDFINIMIAFYEDKGIAISVEDCWNGKKKIGAESLMNLAKESRAAMLVDPNSNRTIRGRWLSMIVLSWSDSFLYEDNKLWWLTAKITKNFNEACTDWVNAKIWNKIKIPKKIKISSNIF